jgi:hypothetical protein
VTEPNGGETFTMATHHDIRWDSSSVGISKVRIWVKYQYTCEGCSTYWYNAWQTNPIDNYGYYAWFVMLDEISGRQFKVVVEGLDTNDNPIGVWDESDAPFIIVPGVLPTDPIATMPTPAETPTPAPTATSTNTSDPAGPVCIGINANVSAVDDPGGYLGGAIKVGDVVKGEYVYDSTASDTNSLPTVGDYNSTTIPYGITLNVEGLVFRTDPGNVNFLVEIANDHGSTPRDNYLIRSYNNIFPASAPSDPPFDTMN